ncbi:dihydrofolate reductase [Anaeroplasma bactoclasticum]|uniref:dihydrofolate reductase n=1 Tax=Anaeroplasma bactoclasticum TaxID=2088 RepID=A0A397RWE3_9MOLU|nr:dihydrofolate reductase [Anaeroplasma bactoclasticum]RIA75947.1 dihydrofolate reductase [Anaeroplasma bactoclasticum]
MINMIWAMDFNNLIGDKDRIPWHIKEDLIYYKNKTKGKTVLMGDATYFSLKSYYKTKPLPYGKVYIATIDKNLKIENPLEDIEIVYDLIEFIKNFKDEIWVCGGATIYKLCLPYADRLYISFIKGDYKGDKYFPKIDYSLYDKTWEEDTEQVRYTLFERR